MRTRLLFALAVPMLLAIGTDEAHAQKKGGQGQAQSDKPKKQKVTTVRAVEVTRLVLVEQGYQVVRVEQVGPTQVVYFCRGNRGRGKGCGPVQKLIVRPTPEAVVFESAPRNVLLQLNVRLGL